MPVMIRRKKPTFDFYANVPQEMKSRKQWVVWKYADLNGRRTKPPYNPKTGRKASPTNPATWGTFSDALAAQILRGYNGIGYMFTDDDGLVGIDLDDCRNSETGALAQWAQEITSAIEGYWEVSPSQQGVKGFVRAEKPSEGRRKKIEDGEIEMYGSGRYFTVTGKNLSNSSTELLDCSEAVNRLITQVWGNGQEMAGQPKGWVIRANDPFSDSELVEKAKSAGNGEKFRRLFNDGDTSDYGSDSEADAALAMSLAFWAGRDGHEQIERIISSSALYRDKWDGKRGGTTWLRKLIIHVCNNVSETYGGTEEVKKLTPKEADALNPLNFVIRLDQVKSKPIEWLWRGWIPAGKLSLLSGDPGLGKTTVAIDLAARMSVGRSMPGCSTTAKPSATLILTAEDDLADTVVPRIKAAGGDTSLIIAMPEVADRTDGDGQPVLRMPSLPDDINRIRAIINHYAVKLVIVDPMMAYLSGNVDVHRDHDVRRVLSQLSRLAETTGAAVLLIRHLTKNTQVNAIHRGGGSVGITGAARSEILCAPDPADANARVLATIKSNLCEAPDAYGFHLGTRDGEEVAHIVWDGVTDHTAESLLSGKRDRESVVNRAEAFLRAALEGGARPSREVKAEAEDVDVSWSSIKKARDKLNVQTMRVGNQWVMSLPE